MDKTAFWSGQFLPACQLRQVFQQGDIHASCFVFGRVRHHQSHGKLSHGLVVQIYSQSTTTKSAENDPYSQVELVTKDMELIRREYVDADKLTCQDMAYGAMRGMLESLDPHSQFMPPENYQDMREDTEGKFGGLGIVVSMSPEGFLTVVAPMEDTPGARAGLLPGDRIIKIGGKVTEKMSLEDAVSELRGMPGTTEWISNAFVRSIDPRHGRASEFRRIDLS